MEKQKGEPAFLMEKIILKNVNKLLFQPDNMT